VRMWEAGLVRVTNAPGGEEITPLEAAASLRARLADEEDAESDAAGDENWMPQLLASPGEMMSTITLAQAKNLLAADRPVYLTPLYYSEKGAATRLRRLLLEGDDRLEGFQNPAFDWTRALESATQDVGIELAPQQAEAVRAALTHRLTVLTGGPGTGKTTTVRTILELCRRQRGRAILAAPTGRAAKRLAETTGQEAKTIHRLLEFKPTEGMSFQRNEENPLEGDLLIVDEASMLDLALSHHLLRAIPPGMHLLLVGDVDQLPSVGAGNVLKDIIAAIEEAHTVPATVGARGLHSAPLRQRAKVIRLQTIFRQASDSYIIANAHRINQGQTPIIDNEAALDFFHFKTEEPERAAQLCVELVKTRIPRRFGIPSSDIQVLSPMHRGIAGVAALNEALQNALNPPGDKPQRVMGSRVYRLGDRVMQIRNNYDKEVYNGDMGEIVAMDMVNQQATVRIDGRNVTYDFLELDELVHAYAVSIHKSQGSEFPAVVIPLLTSHYMMLQRNLLYTAVSRARRLVVLVGQTKAIAMAVRNNEVATRFTGLRERLLGSGE
jgi:exodeoxyribonuclease V alpha subunit